MRSKSSYIFSCPFSAITSLSSISIAYKNGRYLTSRFDHFLATITLVRVNERFQALGLFWPHDYSISGTSGITTDGVLRTFERILWISTIVQFQTGLSDTLGIRSAEGTCTAQWCGVVQERSQILLEQRRSPPPSNPAELISPTILDR